MVDRAWSPRLVLPFVVVYLHTFPLPVVSPSHISFLSVIYSYIYLTYPTKLLIIVLLIYYLFIIFGWYIYNIYEIINWFFSQSLFRYCRPPILLSCQDLSICMFGHVFIHYIYLHCYTSAHKHLFRVSLIGQWRGEREREMGGQMW